LIILLDKTLIHHLESFKALSTVCTETVFWTLNRLFRSKVHYMEKNPGMFSSKTLIYFSPEERKTWTSWMTWGELSAKVFFFKVNYSFKKACMFLQNYLHTCNFRITLKVKVGVSSITTNVQHPPG